MKGIRMAPTVIGLAKRTAKLGIAGLGSVVRSGSASRAQVGLSAPQRALRWVRSQESETGGIRVHSESVCSYPEVTGYIVPTLLHYGERELAFRLTRWLMCIQRGDGSYTSPDGDPYVFDTGQVLRGLLAAHELLSDRGRDRAAYAGPGWAKLGFSPLDAARRAADYLCSQMVDGGRGGFGTRYQGASPTVPETVHLYVLPPLIRASELLGAPQYRDAALRCLDSYASHPDLLRIESLTHFLAYEMEALIDLGRADLVLPALAALRDLQEKDGSVRGAGGAQWVCTPGLAQLAMCWYKVGQPEPADAAMRWLEAHQEPSGGFRGSYGPRAEYHANVELPWAAKFFLDAHRLRLNAFFSAVADALPSDIDPNDGRARAVVALVKPGDRVVEVGCGKGRFLKVIKDAYPDVECVGVDVSPELLKSVPPDIEALEGSLEATPLPDNSFDVVLSVEAIEHSVNPEAAVAEMTRIAKPGGTVAIIDKQQAHWGEAECPPWERWPDMDGMKRLLNRGCDGVTAKLLSHRHRPADGLMVLWSGRKRSRLNDSGWNSVIFDQKGQRGIVQRLRYNSMPEWAQVIMLATSPGERVLEVGSGTGEMSLRLAQAGRQVTVLDYSPDSLKLTKACAEELGVPIDAVLADATKRLPFGDAEFHCVWSSGVLEFYSPEERAAVITEMARTSSDRVLVMVSNGASLAYRAGKQNQVLRGAWAYGPEMLAPTLRDEFGAAGLDVVTEYTVGAKHALKFLPSSHPLRRELEAWMDAVTRSELDDCHQGYLLVTFGRKHCEA